MKILDPHLKDGIHDWRDGRRLYKEGDKLYVEGTTTLAGRFVTSYQHSTSDDKLTA
jgi:N-acetylglucosamine-6-phosphate deacetylase